MLIKLNWVNSINEGREHLSQKLGFDIMSSHLKDVID